MLTEAGRLWRIGGGAVGVALACLILLTSLFGLSADGATRWVSAGGILLQPGLFLVPAVALGFARARDSASLLAVLIAALALALQPDRAMAGALARGHGRAGAGAARTKGAGRARRRAGGVRGDPGAGRRLAGNAVRGPDLLLVLRRASAGGAWRFSPARR